MGQAQIRLQIYSGREPPTWSLSAADTTRLVNLVAALPSGDRSVPEAKLGEYGGFFVDLPNGSKLRVYEGVVDSTAGATTKTLVDSAREVERLLVDSAKPHIPENLYTQVVSQANLP